MRLLNHCKQIIEFFLLTLNFRFMQSGKIFSEKFQVTLTISQSISQSLHKLLNWDLKIGNAPIKNGSPLFGIAKKGNSLCGSSL